MKKTADNLVGKRRVDIFVGQPHADGYLAVMYRREHKGFVFYHYDHIRTTIEGGSGKRIHPNTLKTSRVAKREWVAAQEAQGFVVKSVQYIGQDMLRRYNTERFEVVDRLTQMLDVARVWAKEKGFIMMGVFGEYGTMVHDPRSFGDVTYGTIKRAIGQATIFEVKPKDDAEEI